VEPKSLKASAALGDCDVVGAGAKKSSRALLDLGMVVFGAPSIESMSRRGLAEDVERCGEEDSSLLGIPSMMSKTEPDVTGPEGIGFGFSAFGGGKDEGISNSNEDDGDCWTGACGG